MVENQQNKTDQILEEELLDTIVTTPYKYGFTTDLETEEFEKGLNEEIVRKISFLLYPIIPQSSIKALKIFNISEDDINLSSVENNKFLLNICRINKIDILFKKIDKNDD